MRINNTWKVNSRLEKFKEIGEKLHERLVLVAAFRKTTLDILVLKKLLKLAQV